MPRLPVNHQRVQQVAQPDGLAGLVVEFFEADWLLAADDAEHAFVVTHIVCRLAPAMAQTVGFGVFPELRRLSEQVIAPQDRHQ
ncbi:hypothetical protein D3C85_1587780 [compost metagenome]